jgi:hypothetical protein
MDNKWKVQKLCDECLGYKLNPEGCIIEMKHQMELFDYFYGVKLSSMHAVKAQ